VTGEVIITTARACHYFESLQVFIRMLRNKMLPVENNVKIWEANSLLVPK
jgi:hypothetical protein